MHMLLERQISIGRGLAVGAFAAVSSLAVTVMLDSAFWERWLWPEGEVLWFNTAENRWSDSPLMELDTPAGVTAAQAETTGGSL